MQVVCSTILGVAYTFWSVLMVPSGVVLPLRVAISGDSLAAAVVILWVSHATDF